VDEHRPLDTEGRPERTPDRGDVVAVDRAQVGEAEGLEHQPRHEQGLGGVLQRPADLGHPRDHPQAALQLAAHLRERGVEACALEQGVEGADVRRDAHAVVVEDDRDGSAEGAGLVQALVGHPAGEGAVADHADDVPVAPARLPLRLGQAGGVRDRRARVARAHDVVLALAAAQEPADPTVLAEGPELAHTAREQLVAVRLVPDVPQDLVAGGVELGVERDGELHRAQAGAEVPARLRDRLDDRAPHLLGKLLEPAVAELPHVPRLPQRREQRVGVG
jgi:hypothetical protein